jgi:hypothetical protein
VAGAVSGPAPSSEQLSELVRAASGRPGADVAEWRRESLYGGVGAINDARHLYRFVGTARDGDDVVPWSLVLKWFRPTGREDPTLLSYWRREILAFASGLLDDLPGRVAAPRCYGVDDFPDGAVGLWLEELVDADGPRWPLERFGVAARHLGQFGAHYLRSGVLPDYPWLGGGYLRRWTGPRTQVVDGDERTTDHPFLSLLAHAPGQPVIGRHWTRELVAATRRLYEERERLFDAHDRLPRTLVHGDTGRRNLFGRRRPDGTDETVLIDWGYCGIGAVGEDLHLMVVWTAQMFDVELGQMDEIEQLVLDGYQAGLADAGVDLDPRLARLGYLVPAAIRNSFMPFGAVMPEPAQVEGIERAFGRPFEEWVERTIGVRRFMLDRAEQARQLVDEFESEGLLGG